MYTHTRTQSNTPLVRKMHELFDIYKRDQQMKLLTEKETEELVVEAAESSACKTYVDNLSLHNFMLELRIIPSAFNSHLN